MQAPCLAQRLGSVLRYLAIAAASFGEIFPHIALLVRKSMLITLPGNPCLSKDIEVVNAYEHPDAASERVGYVVRDCAKGPNLHAVSGTDAARGVVHHRSPDVRTRSLQSLLRRADHGERRNCRAWQPACDRLRQDPARARFGTGPRKVFTPVGYLDTPNDDPTLLYQDITVALRSERRINNGQPILHARSISALGISAGETVGHIGAGTGYYTAVLTDLAGPTSSVTAFEIEADLAASAADNLSERPNVRVVAASGSSASLEAM